MTIKRLTAVSGTWTPRDRASRGDCRETSGPQVARVEGRAVSDKSRGPLAAPCHPNDENSRGKVQNVRGDSSDVLPSEASYAT
jgi:hypothetical protein